jgi:sulfonate transport system ATP-binding protein
LALDEPLGALDALTRIEMHDLIERMWTAQRFTGVLVTHDVGEAVALADRVLVLDAGVVALDLAIDLPRPRHRGAAAFAALEERLLDQILERG